MTHAATPHSQRRVTRWAAVLLLFILAGGALLTWWTVRQAGQEMRERLLAQSERVVHGLDICDVRALTGTAADLTSPYYLRLKAQLALIRRAHEHCRFVYLMGRRNDPTAPPSRGTGDTVFIYMDSEVPESQDYSPPGQVYAEASAALRAAFDTGQPVVEGPLADRWGTWTSALAPVRAPQAGTVMALFGMDIDAGDWNRMLRQAAWPPVLLTLVLVMVVLASWALFAWRHRRAGQGARWLWRLETVVVLVLGAVLTSYAAWTTHGREVRTRSQLFMQLADSETDRIIDIIGDIRDIELGNLALFVESSENVTLSEFQHYTKLLQSDLAVHAWQWIPAVPAAEKTRVEQQYRAAGLPAFEIWQHDAQGARVPAHGRPMYYPVVYIIPPAGNERVRGFDNGSESTRHAALAAAAASGLATGTEPICLLQETNQYKGMVVFQPVYQTTPEHALRGFVVAVLRMDELLRSLQKKTALHLYLALLRDDQASEQLASSCNAAADAAPQLAVSRPVAAFGKMFWVTAQPDREFLRHHPPRAGLVTVLIGTLLTLALAALIGMPMRRRHELERLVAEQTQDLRDSEQRYRLLFTGSRDGIVVVDERMHILNANAAYCAMLGYTLDELRAMDNFFRITPEKWQAWERREIWQNILVEREYSVLYEKEYIRKDGTVFPVELQAYTVRDAAAAFHYSWAMVRDITERKRVEAERARLVAAMEQAAETMVITDPAGVIQYVNPAFTAVTGYTRAEAIGNNPRMLKSGQQSPAFYRDLWQTIAAGRVWHGRFINRKKDGTLYTDEATISPVHDNTGDVVNYVAVRRDISENLRLAEQLHQAQKMESIGQLAGGIAHDFNNMLGVILGHTELALAALDPAQSVVADLQEIHAAAQRSASLTRQLLTFARKQAIAPKVLNLNETVEGMLKMLRRLIGEHIDLAWLPGTGLWPVKMDPSQLDQILANLCVNARDAIAGVGRVTITTANACVDEAQCARCPECTPGEYVMLAVSDDGCGMDAEIQSHIFEPFFTTKEPGRGTGLGLATVYGIVTQNRGFISVASEPGKGTTCRIHVPRHAESTGAAAAAEPAANTICGTGQTILLVEDEPAVLALNQRMLEKLGYVVLAAASPAEALHVDQNHTGNLHLLMTDMVMPGMNGRDLADAIIARHPGIPCLFMSGYTTIAIDRQGDVGSGACYIQKPFSLAELAAKVHAAMNK